MPKKKKENQTDNPEEGEESGKKKKVKVIYYDDGSTVADMSGTYRGGKRVERRKSTLKEKWQTYFAVMKKMILPLICTLTAFTLIYLFLLMITGHLS